MKKEKQRKKRFGLKKQTSNQFFLKKLQNTNA